MMNITCIMELNQDAGEKKSCNMKSYPNRDEGFYQLRDLSEQQAERTRAANGDICQSVLPAFSTDTEQKRLVDGVDWQPSNRDILITSMRFKSRLVR